MAQIHCEFAYNVILLTEGLVLAFAPGAMSNVALEHDGNDILTAPAATVEDAIKATLSVRFLRHLI